ncbi:two-component sensor histidine kinase BarA [Thalassotalea sp. PP2-459]|uniref:two-component sensor histidine kinase BarA n=1 Tax=Thalassotalea sp. PP2-459 TaxID=1742724 RepID=UPI0009441039|nr:two-component sensor histidine kinase BarA [Thalassotalea sp. PP2-459]OKY25878.1 two-component sensor histidine kinase BarA [Thalassotalea sp. PP2-459]
MQKLSLKDWVILLTIVPTTLIGLFIASYFSYSSYTNLNEYLENRSRSIIEPIAISATKSLQEKERSSLRELVNFAHRSQSSLVKSITIFTKDNQVFVTSAYHGDTELMRISVGEQIPLNTQFIHYDDHLILRTPIIDEKSNTQVIANNNLQQVTVGYVAMQIDKNSVQFAQQNQFLIAFSIALVGAFLSALLSITLIKNVTRPITSMVQAVDRIREGKLESRVTGQLIGELNFLKNGVNAMAQSLGDYQDEMQRSIDQATLDLRESLEQFEIQNVELDIAKRKAQEANKVKSEFLANMSHELRTPLNGVIGFTRQVLKTPLSDTQRDYLQTIERSAANLLAIINDILDFSKLDAGKMVIEKIPFSMRETVEESTILLAPSAHSKNIELSLRVVPNVPDSLIGDAMRIKQVLINLANNAIKFTDKGSVNIDIDCERQSENIAQLKITVHDTGIGINTAQQASIFEAFGQGDQSVTRLYGGTGLGLVISQRLVKEMNGDIGFISNEKNGSTFWFTFQCEINPIPDDALLSPPALSNKRILYLESHTHSRIANSEILESWQMHVTPVENLEQVTAALTSKKQFDYALIGHEVTPTAINELKQLIVSLKVHIPSIHLAINSNSPNLQEALLVLGAKSCLSKPLTPEKLCKSLVPQHFDFANSLTEVLEHKVPIKVLAVDDNDANLKLINALLMEQVSEVLTAVNGQEAVDICKNEKFALIFMDIQMPIMDGISALNHIKTNSLNEQTPIIAVTAHALSSEKDKLLKEGFDSYMTKPIDETMLRHTIYEYCDLDLLGTQASRAKILNADFSATEQEEYQTDKLLENTGDNGTLSIATSSVINWPLALKRAGRKQKLAQDMLTGLIESLPEVKQDVTESLASQDLERLKILIHKLNGACCYSGVPDLGKMVHQIETELKRGAGIDELEPEFYEFFEHVDRIIAYSTQALAEIETISNQQED